MSDMSDTRDLVATRESVARSEESLVRFLTELAPVDPTQPSRLPGWSIGHVLTHIARNADSHVSMLSGLSQYPNGPDGRNADIEAGAGRPWHELVADVETAGTALTAAYAS
ncbi:MAG TPA: maleylpyruvate isomerase family mycothiol-dependent enzyme, partial [Ilumatobacter sp.]|nr:maleylpyruvate isomerase family mycothiol-dependent enzyme [Ilumatobacter sp.]